MSLDKSSPEYLHAEKPTLDQLQMMGWQNLEGDRYNPSITERENFKQVLLIQRLRKAIKNINRDENDQPWLDDDQIETAINTLERAVTSQNLIEANQIITELLIKGTNIEDNNQKNHPIHYIDYQNIGRNDFLAINQFRVDSPWATSNKNFAVPDIVLFVNGIPLVVIECKSPNLTNPLSDGINDLIQYSNQGDSNNLKAVEKLFHYNLLMVALSQHRAVVGTIGSKHEHYLAWKDTYPDFPEAIAALLQVNKLDERQSLIAGMLRPQQLLDILHNFTAFSTKDSKTIKLVPRYIQYRAVLKTIKQLQENPTRLQDGLEDQRGGIIWHTQGSGKSLTMIYLIRKMRTIPKLKRYKIVIVTDRKDLEKQLSDTATLTGEPLKVAKKAKKLEQLLAQPGADLIFGMIQKFRQDDNLQSEENWENLPPHLNDSEEILVIVDEAHRSHSSNLHLNLLTALPNCARIGFTGTPIIARKKKSTQSIFGRPIDTYTIRDSQDDNVTLRIYYEGIEARARVSNGDNLDQLFELIFRDKTPAERATIKQKYATQGDVSEAKELIQAKAKDMLRHYIESILPGGFKAQVVASSRRAAIRYQEAFALALKDLLQQIESQKSILQSLDEEAITQLSDELQFLAKTAKHLKTLQRLETAVIISEDKDDPPDWQEWTNGSKQENYISRFKQDLVEDGLAFLIVKSMLLTGFDAPVEQVLYIDRNMIEHELLQAIARVNRTRSNKEYGLVVDYYGIDIASALAMYDTTDLENAWFDLREEIPILEERQRRVLSLFEEHQTDINDLQACEKLLEDERLRVRFAEDLKAFLESLDLVLPRPAAASHIPIAQKLGQIRKSVADRYRDEQINLIGARAKVRELIDTYIQAQGIDPKTPPIDILALNYRQQVQRLPSARTQAAEMEHAARHHIAVHLEEDPVYYQNLSDRLADIIQSFADNWEAKAAALDRLTQDIQRGRQNDDSGLDPKTERPFFDILQKESNGTSELIILATQSIVAHLIQTINRIDFWKNFVAQQELKTWIVNYLDQHDLVPFERQEAIADSLVQLAKNRREQLKP